VEPARLVTTRDGGEEALGTLGRREAARSAAFLREALPGSLRSAFGEAFVRSHILYGEFVCRLVLRIARESGMATALGVPGDAGEIAARAGLASAQARVPVDWMLRFLASRGWLERVAGEAGRRYRSRGELPGLDPSPVRQEQQRWEPSWLPAYTLAETVARDYPAFLRGEVAGEDVLFAPRRLRLWVDYFSNDNGLYAVNNRVGAVAVADWLPGPGSSMLELGGGLASGAVALLAELEARDCLGDIRGYRFTEPVSAFLRRGEQTLRDRFPALASLTFGALDMNQRFAEQGVAPASVSVVYAVNTLHAARDLGFTLQEVRRTLSPGGRLVISECVRAAEPIYADFVFNLAEAFRSPRLDPRYRPHGGFLGTGAWTGVLEAAGFDDVRVLPDVAAIRVEVPDWSVAAIGGVRPGGRP
jgi:SAM-dependent methyltransferase